jgi:hypothetical protein
MFHSVQNLGFSLTINIIIALLAFIVAYYSYRSYKLIKENNFGFYSLAFLFFAASFAINAVGLFLNSLCVFDVHKFAFYGRDASYLLFRFFMTLGVSLFYLSIRKENKHIIRKLLTFILMILIIISTVSEIVFYLVLTAILLNLILYYFNNFLKQKNSCSVFTLLSVLLLLVGILLFLFTMSEVCIIQPLVFFASFVFMFFVVVKSYC